MADPRLFRLRVRFVEQGRLALLSHLEVARALERAVRRAGLPFAVSQGFSPHMRIAFGAALPVGVGSTCELFDVFLTDYVAPAKALAALQEASVDDLRPYECSYVDRSALAASVACPLSAYEAHLSETPERFAFPEVITVVRKKKEKELVVREFLQGEPTMEPLEDGTARLAFRLLAKPSGSLRPDVFLNAALDEMKRTEAFPSDARLLSITRIAQE